jgi:arylsulfatase A-like enzyme
MNFTNYHGEQLCIAVRSSYVTGQNVFRIGLFKMCLPGVGREGSIQCPKITT